VCNSFSRSAPNVNFTEDRTVSVPSPAASVTASPGLSKIVGGVTGQHVPAALPVRILSSSLPVPAICGGADQPQVFDTGI
jgi:hypothetical protein